MDNTNEKPALNPFNPYQHEEIQKEIRWAHGAKFGTVPVHVSPLKCRACIWEAGFNSGKDKRAEDGSITNAG